MQASISDRTGLFLAVSLCGGTSNNYSSSFLLRLRLVLHLQNIYISICFSSHARSNQCHWVFINVVSFLVCHTLSSCNKSVTITSLLLRNFGGEDK